MPEITVIHVAIFAAAIIAGVVAGWVMRGGRSEREKTAINAGWQEQLSAKDAEHGRLADQNKRLMEQVSQFRASDKDSRMRAHELSDALKEAFERRDALQREIKDIRGNLESSLAEKEKIQSSFDSRVAQQQDYEQLIAAKDERIEVLTRELDNWQNRLPPLMERFRERNDEARRLEEQYSAALERIEQLEAELAAAPESDTQTDPTQTRVEPMHNPDALTDGLDASNEPIDNEPAERVRINGAEDPSLLSLRDNLKLIKGVGPAIEKTLNEMGIFRFNQIAEMSEYDIDRVARKLKGFRTRIYREDWIGQARNLHDDKLSG